MTLIRDNPDQFSRLIDASAERRHLDPGLVEKDYWAVEALRTARIAFDIPIGTSNPSSRAERASPKHSAS